MFTSPRHRINSLADATREKREIMKELLSKNPEYYRGTVLRDPRNRATISDIMAPIGYERGEGVKSMYNFTVEKMTNGWVVIVGCFRLVFDDPKKLGLEIARYLEDPAKVYDEYLRKYQTDRMEDQAGEGEVTREQNNFLRGGLTASDAVKLKR